MFCYLHYSDVESVPSSVESTAQFSRQDSGEHSADTLQAAAHNGETPETIHTNDISLDTPHSQLEQNNAPSANSSGSPDGGQRSPRLQLCPVSDIHPPCESCR